jgi:transposase-like protein/transcription elongation factor Elf1
MAKIILDLTKLIQSLYQIIYSLLIFIATNIKLPDVKDEKQPVYSKTTIDKVPIIIEIEKLDYKLLLKEHKAKTNKQLKPVNRRNGKTVSRKHKCPRCDAPSKYMYDNNGGRGQLKCKVCGHTFDVVLKVFKMKIFKCPYCGQQLDRQKERKDHNVHVCTNRNCTFYLQNKAKISIDKFDEYQKHPERFNLKYRYREFTTDFFKMDLHTLPKGACNFNFRKFSPHILGLVLTYAVNCNLSSRNTAKALREIHGISISHTHVQNYARAAASVLKPFVDTFDYNPSNHLSADETYVKIKGVKGYIWFIMDVCSRSILAYKLSKSRATGACIMAMRSAFDKYKTFPQNIIKFISDGYPAYKLAHSEFKEKDNKEFILHQVIGLTNEDDEVAKEFRWMKQMIERLNRTFKYHYRTTTGYMTLEGGDMNLVLFVTYYNFLRPESHVNTRTLNSIEELESIQLMPNKWLKLLELSQNKILELQAQIS